MGNAVPRPSRALSALAVLAAGLALGAPRARAQTTVQKIQYDRRSNTLLAPLPQGKPFLLEGTIYPHERRVEVFYRKRSGDNCKAKPEPTLRCPRREKGKEWACQGWERDSDQKPSDKAETFSLLIPRLRHSIASYCIQVVYFRGLNEERKAAMVDKLLQGLSQRRTMRNRAGRRVTLGDVIDVVDRFIRKERLWNALPPNRRQAATMRKIKSGLVSYLWSLSVVERKVLVFRKRFQRAARVLLRKTGFKRIRPWLKTVTDSTDANIKKLRELKVLKDSTTLLAAVDDYVDLLDEADDISDLEEKLTADRGALIQGYAKLVHRLCKRVAKLRSVNRALPVKACPVELTSLRERTRKMVRTWKKFQSAGVARKALTENIAQRVGKHLTDRVFRGASRPDPATLESRQLIEYYFSTDLGLAAVFVPGVDKLETAAMLYFGIHVYFQPVNNAVPLRVEDGFFRRFSIFFGFNFNRFKINTEQVKARGLFGSTVLLAGIGFRLTDFIRINVGAILYRLKKQNPLFQDQPGDIAVTGFVSFSLNIHVYSWIKGQLGKL